MKTAICVIVKNEAASLAEWLAYHLAIGFDSILLFNNASTDGTAGIADRFAQHHDVRRIDWPDTSPSYQLAAYDHALAQFRREFDWIGFIDSDEFVVPMRHSTIGAFLADMTEGSAIAVNWLMFGSSGHQDAPPGLVIENFCQRSEAGFGPNRHVKCLLRPGQAVRSVNPHYFEMKGVYLTPQGRPVTWEHEGITLDIPNLDVLRVHHYFVKSAAQWAQKIVRGYHDMKRSSSEFLAYDRNEVTDAAILRFVPATRAIMAGVMP